jgi:hypothetical protein
MTYRIQIDDTVRDATADEAAAIDANTHVSVEEHIAARKAALESARAKLNSLGLTEPEIKALVG